MFEIATVIEVDDGWATIRVQRSLACQGCDACGYSTANRMMVGRARNATGAQVGDCVRIEVPTGQVVLVAATIYLIPLVAMIGGYAAGTFVFSSSGAAATGVAGLVAGLLLVRTVGGRLSSSRASEPVVRDIIRRNPDMEV